MTGHEQPSSLTRRLIDDCYPVVLPGVVVGPDQDFFELGGDSLQLIRLVSVVQETFGVEIDAVRFFEEPTVLCLTDQVRARLSTSP
ncbi:acyl carrier protein [Nocardiopsis sp. ARC36]